jgi:hypothetical protein
MESTGIVTTELFVKKSFLYVDEIVFAKKMFFYAKIIFSEKNNFLTKTKI